ncbi:MAG TPA: response regulator [Armatimonadota bacterium]|jgi:CheY-like chemotaxis protein
MSAKAKRHILLVEDDCDVRELLTLTLRENDYQVTAVPDGLQAYVILDGGLTIHVLVTDYQLPGQYGDELIKRLRSLPRRIPAVMMSAQPDVAQLARHCDADAAYRKGDAIAGLLATLATLCA